MKCPIDQTVLVISERSGIEIDSCPSCRGVWLDRGEIDKLIERAPGGGGGGVGAVGGSVPRSDFGAQDHADTDQARYEREHAAWQREYAGSRSGSDDYRGGDRYPGAERRSDDRRGDDLRGDDLRGDDRRDRRPKKRESWLSELFD